MLNVVPPLTEVERIKPVTVDALDAVDPTGEEADSDEWWAHLLASGDPAQPDLDESWLPINLAAVLAGDVSQPEPTILARDDQQCLLYLGQVNGFHGPSGEGKGWVTLLAVVQQIGRGHDVLLIDAEDVATSIVARLRLLGATDEQIERHVIYIRPQASFEERAVNHLVDLIVARRVTLAVIDSLGECFGLDAIDENHDSEVGPWLRRVARRLAEAGPAVLLIDHATKSQDNPLHPSGSKRKRAAIGGASYLVTATVALVAGKGGRLRLTCAKDRHGTYARGEHVADLALTATPQNTMRVELYTPSDSDGATPLPALLAARAAVKAAKEQSGPLSVRGLVAAMPIKAGTQTKRDGIELAIVQGALTESTGPRNARLVEYVADLPGDPS